MRPHILSFRPLEMEMETRNGHNIEKTRLEGSMRLSFSVHRECIGYKSESSWHACPNSAINTKQCPTCSFRDISRIYTIGDFSNYPHMEKELEKEIYAIYLVAFGEDIIKCGITRKERLEERLAEQGADFGCAIFEVQGPEQVYEIEKRLQWNFDFANAVRVKEKIARLSFEKEKARENLEKAAEKVCSSRIFYDSAIEPKIFDLSWKYPSVTGAGESDKIEGQVFGSKGHLVFWRDFGGKEFFTNLKAQEGKFIV